MLVHSLRVAGIVALAAFGLAACTVNTAPPVVATTPPPTVVQPVAPAAPPPAVIVQPRSY